MSQCLLFKQGISFANSAFLPVRQSDGDLRHNTRRAAAAAQRSCAGPPGSLLLLNWRTLPVSNGALSHRQQQQLVG